MEYKRNIEETKNIKFNQNFKKYFAKKEHFLCSFFINLLNYLSKNYTITVTI